MGPSFAILIYVIVATCIATVIGLLLGPIIGWIFIRKKNVPKENRRRRFKIYSLSSISVTGLLWITFMVLISVTFISWFNDEQSFERASGFTDYWRWPVEFPVEMGTTSLDSDADIRIWPDKKTLFRGVASYTKLNQYIIGKCLRKEPQTDSLEETEDFFSVGYFIFDCESLAYSEFSHYDKFVDSLAALNIHYWEDFKPISWHYQEHMNSL